MQFFKADKNQFYYIVIRTFCFSGAEVSGGKIRTWIHEQDLESLEKVLWEGEGFALLQVWSLTQFYSVDFSQPRIGVNKCVFYKRTIKVCVNCC